MKATITFTKLLQAFLFSLCLLLSTMVDGQPSDVKGHIEGDFFVQTNLGNLLLGFPGTGANWAMATQGSGANLLFRSKPNGSSTTTTRFIMNQAGEFQMGTSGTPTAWSHILYNSSTGKPHLKLEEVGNDYARLEMRNNSSTAFWQLAGFPSNTTASARLNFYFSNGADVANRMVLTGDGELGIRGTPGARLELYQESQNVGSGLRFDDGTANLDWDITHGFALRFHYGGSLRGYINANTGAYVQSSDERLKSNIVNLPSIMDRVKLLRPTSYYYTDSQDKTQTFGFLAQEVLPIFPELVSYSQADELYGINYAGFSVVAIKAVQELQSVIINQEHKISDLEARLARLEKLID